MIQTEKVNVGKGLLRLYLVLWMLLGIASLVGGHREVLTYVGSTYWSAEKVVQRQKAEFHNENQDCTSKECRDRAFFQEFPESDKVIYPEKAKESVEFFAILVFVVPAVLLLVLAVIFKLVAWAFAGFRAT